MKRILHVTYDYPSLITPNKTPTIENLVEGTNNKYKNTVIVLNRVSRLAQEKILSEENLYLINTFGLPKGILFRHTIARAIENVKCLKHKCDLNYQRFDLIHAHKLCFEGPIAAYICNEFGMPFIVSMRGSDIRVLKYRIDLRNYYRQILKKAKKIIIISPWMAKALLDIFHQPFYEINIKPKLCCLGSVVDVNQNIRGYKTKPTQKKLVTILKITKPNIKVKNIKRLLKAFKKVHTVYKGVSLDIIGDGEARDRLNILIKRYSLEDTVNLLGYIDNSNLNDIIYKYVAFVLPSARETFGLSYIEALRNGLPIIYSRGTGVDGFFKEDIGIKVDHFSSNSICRGIIKIIEMNKEYKKNVADYVKSGGLQQFSREYVIGKYCEVIDSIIV